MFHADLDQLDALLADLAHDHQALQQAAVAVGRALARLHDEWNGDAATAHLAAQAEWDAGFSAMRAALASMRTAATTAHDNYGGAAHTNVAMWEQVS